ncbi:hypothetical protein J3U01_01560 [Bifidobacterium sp. B4107]|uniref:hypothetical protein n=1 Tax=unclassified Bifidobacterium TaxID=2608897 RepID=UPI00226BB2B9|nr:MULTISPECIES: hypothetical protein [unclassified Bifidobacterium]MCX8647109.1 hypothetical protein [Bifidobacterium sp. B4107]MCX8651289.1 hypothetical protein [Bifidobacterium sp. B4111]MCX8657719.1 hypothetical protein [Bifidobacterium sp. B4114]
MAGRRGYAKLKNDFYLNGKIRELRACCPSAVGAFVFAIAYCSDNLTDGRIPGRDLRYVLGVTDEEIDAMCAVDLLEPDGDSGYVIHDYTEHNCRRDQVEKKRERNAEDYRKRKHGHHSDSKDEDSEDFQTDESDLSRTKHKNTRTQEDLSNDKSPYSPQAGGGSDDEPEYRQPSSQPTREYEQLMSIYPNHDNPDDGLRELKRVLHRKSPHTSFAALLNGAQILANEHRDPQYVPTLGNWLRNGGWKNKPKPKPQARQPDLSVSRAQQNLEWNAALVKSYAQEEDQQSREEIAA